MITRRLPILVAPYIPLALVAVSHAIAEPQWIATRLDGTTIQGRPVNWESGRVTLATSAGEKQLAVEGLASLHPKSLHPTAAPTPPAHVAAAVLVDGTVIPLADYEASDGQARLHLPGASPPAQSPLELPLEKVASVMLRPVDADQRAQWEEVRSAGIAADLMVVTRREEAGLDYLEGLVGRVTKSHVDFTMDGQPVPVKRSKVVGLIYLRGPDESSESALCRLEGAGGLVVTADAITWRDGLLHVVSSAGPTLTISPSEVTKIDFSAGKLIYLSDLEAESIHWEPLVALPENATIARSFALPRRDRAQYGSDLALTFEGKGERAARPRRQTYAKGLSCRSGTEIVYRLPKGFRRFYAVVGIDPAHRQLGNVELSLLADDRLLLETQLAGTDEPLSIELDIDGAKKLTVRVDFGQGGEVGDLVNLCDAKITK